MTAREEKLVRELLAIFQRYRDAEIEMALRSLERGDALRAFTDLANRIRPSAGTARPVRRSISGKNSPRAQLDSQIASLRASGKSGSRAIADMLAAARDGSILKTSASIARLLESFGLVQNSRRDRLTLLRTLGSHLVALPDEELVPLIAAAEATGDSASSLDRWTNIIVQRGKD